MMSFAKSSLSIRAINERKILKHFFTKKRLIIAISATTALILLISAILAFSEIKKDIERSRAYNVKPLSDKDFEKIDLDKVKKLMIVAHPDDELIFGGGHLLEGDYLVLCITNGRNKTRRAEFENVIKETGNQGIMLEYPDKVCGKRDEWNNVQDGIFSDIEKVISLKQYDMIVTHNERGEYGHIHHKMTHSLVVEAFEDKKPPAKLYFFGKYHKAVTVDKYLKGEKPLPDDMKERLPDDVVKRKTELAKLYKSQKSTVEGLWHMAPYENFIPYEV